MNEFEEIRLLYIDDNPEPELSRVLGEMQIKGCVIKHSDIEFKPEMKYEELINDSRVQHANIIIIDSKLFENSNSAGGKYTGEEFKLILRKHFPYIEVLVITQNLIEEGFSKIQKYNPRGTEKTASAFYAEMLPPIIGNSIKNIMDYRKIAVNLKSNDSLESVLVEKITNSLEGIGTYDELTKSDIDQIVTAFKEIQEAIHAD